MINRETCTATITGPITVTATATANQGHSLGEGGHDFCLNVGIVVGVGLQDDARAEVECTINLLKQARRFATRYEKTLRNYAAVVAIGCALLWLRI